MYDLIKEAIVDDDAAIELSKMKLLMQFLNCL